MNPTAGDVIQLGGVAYRIGDKLGSGAVANAYRAYVGESEVVVKLLGLADADRLAAVRREAEVLRKLNEAEDGRYALMTQVTERIAWAQATRAQRTIIALYDSGESDGLPYVVQELAPPEVRPLQAHSLEDEGRVLAIMTRVAQAMALAHTHGYALRDFEPPYKSDRIRVEWPAGAPAPVVLMIDWNITGGKEDFANDLFFLGGHLYYLLVGRNLEVVDGKPPYTLGLGVPTWSRLTAGARGLLAKLLHRDAARRYTRAQDVAADLAWLLQAQQLAHHPDYVEQLNGQAFVQLGQNRPDRVLALADLAVRQGVSGETAQTFDALQKRAQRELDKEHAFVLSMIEVSLGTQQYAQAIKEADQQLSHLEPRSDMAQRLRRLKLQAQAGQELRQAGVDSPKSRPEWQSIQGGLASLDAQAWGEALTAFQRAVVQQPLLGSSRAVTALMNLAKAGQQVEQAAALRENAQPYGPDIRRAEWARIEESKITQLEEAQKLVGSATVLAPDELAIQDAQAIYRQDIERRRAAFLPLQRAQEAWRADRFDEMAGPLKEVRQLDAQNPYYAELRPEGERFTAYGEALRVGEQALAQGKYSEAAGQYEQARQIFPERSEWRAPQQTARLGERIARMVANTLQYCREKSADLPPGFRMAELQALSERLNRLQQIDGAAMLTVARDHDVPLDGAPLVAEDARFLLGAQQAAIEEVRGVIDAKGRSRIDALIYQFDAELLAVDQALQAQDRIGRSQAEELNRGLATALDIFRQFSAVFTTSAASAAHDERLRRLAAAWTRLVQQTLDEELAGQIALGATERMPNGEMTAEMHKVSDLRKRAASLQKELAVAGSELQGVAQALTQLTKIVERLAELRSVKAWPLLDERLAYIEQEAAALLGSLLAQAAADADAALVEAEYDRAMTIAAAARRYEQLGDSLKLRGVEGAYAYNLSRLHFTTQICGPLADFGNAPATVGESSQFGFEKKVDEGLYLGSVIRESRETVSGNDVLLNRVAQRTNETIAALAAATAASLNANLLEGGTARTTGAMLAQFYRIKQRRSATPAWESNPPLRINFTPLQELPDASVERALIGVIMASLVDKLAQEIHLAVPPLEPALPGAWLQDCAGQIERASTEVARWPQEIPIKGIIGKILGDLKSQTSALAQQRDAVTKESASPPFPLTSRLEYWLNLLAAADEWSKSAASANSGRGADVLLQLRTDCKFLLERAKQENEETKPANQESIDVLLGSLNRIAVQKTLLKDMDACLACERAALVDVYNEQQLGIQKSIIAVLERKLMLSGTGTVEGLASEIDRALERVKGQPAAANTLLSLLTKQAQSQQNKNANELRKRKEQRKKMRDIWQMIQGQMQERGLENDSNYLEAYRAAISELDKMESKPFPLNWLADWRTRLALPRLPSWARVGLVALAASGLAAAGFYAGWQARELAPSPALVAPTEAPQILPTVTATPAAAAGAATETTALAAQPCILLLAPESVGANSGSMIPTANWETAGEFVTVELPLALPGAVPDACGSSTLGDMAWGDNLRLRVLSIENGAASATQLKNSNFKLVGGDGDRLSLKGTIPASVTSDGQNPLLFVEFSADEGNTWGALAVFGLQAPAIGEPATEAANAGSVADSETVTDSGTVTSTGIVTGTESMTDTGAVTGTAPVTATEVVTDTAATTADTPSPGEPSVPTPTSASEDQED